MTTASRINTRGRFRAVFSAHDGMTVSQLASLTSGLENLLALCSFTTVVEDGFDYRRLESDIAMWPRKDREGDPKSTEPERIVIGPTGHRLERLTMSSDWNVERVSYNSPLEVVFTWAGSHGGAVLTTLPTAALLYFAKYVPDLRAGLARAKTVEEEEALKREVIKAKRRYLRDKGIDDEALSRAVVAQLTSSTEMMAQLDVLERVD